LRVESISSMPLKIIELPSKPYLNFPSSFTEMKNLGRFLVKIVSLISVDQHNNRQVRQTLMANCPLETNIMVPPLVFFPPFAFSPNLAKCESHKLVSSRSPDPRRLSEGSGGGDWRGGGRAAWSGGGSLASGVPGRPRAGGQAPRVGRWEATGRW
jgi:hypothetical protein